MHSLQIMPGIFPY